MKNKTKKNRPVTRSFWKLLRYMPKYFRAQFLRAQFEVEYDLPDDIILKQADTESEIKQALTLVHESYVELDYMDQQENKMRFSKFMALPTTVILIAKRKEEVIGTISIVSDSALGLPSDFVWNHYDFRKRGEIIAEISALCIKKSSGFRRGKLLMALCKIMYIYCLKILRVDGILASTTSEVEPFYTDILLFSPLEEYRGENNNGVKGNPSFYGYLSIPNVEPNYKKVYGGKKDIRKNLSLFFHSESKWIQLAESRMSLQSYFQCKTKAINELIENHEDLLKNFNMKDLQVIQNLDSTLDLTALSSISSISSIKNRPQKRFDVRMSGTAFINGLPPQSCRILNISQNGVQIRLEKSHNQLALGQPITIVFRLKEEWIKCRAEIQWIKSQNHLGCKVGDEKAGSWEEFMGTSKIRDKVPMLRDPRRKRNIA